MLVMMTSYDLSPIRLNNSSDQNAERERERERERGWHLIQGCVIDQLAAVSNSFAARSDTCCL
jgi:hypothetical protein